MRIAKKIDFEMVKRIDLFSLLNQKINKIKQTKPNSSIAQVNDNYSLNYYLIIECKNVSKELGYDRVVKWRCDLEPNNANELLKLFNRECINFYSFVRHEHGYLADFFMEGDVDDMIKLFTIDINPPYPEFAFTKMMYDLEFDKKANFILNKLTKDNDILFKHGYGHYWMTDHQKLNHFSDKLPENKKI